MTEPGSPDWMARVVTSVLLIIGWLGFKALSAKPTPKPTDGDVAQLESENAALRRQLADRDRQVDDYRKGLQKLEARGAVLHMFAEDEEKLVNPGIHLVNNPALEALEKFQHEVGKLLGEVESDNGDTPV